MMEKTVKIGSLFDGSGGFPLAASLCGIEPVWASEIEPYPIAVTRSRFPKMTHLGDVSKVSGADIEPVDIVTFGSPCFPAGTLVLTNKGYRKYTIVSGDICDMCLVKLHRLITVGLTAEEIAWGGTVFKWDDEEDGG